MRRLKIWKKMQGNLVCYDFCNEFQNSIFSNDLIGFFTVIGKISKPSLPNKFQLQWFMSKFVNNWFIFGPNSSVLVLSRILRVWKYFWQLRTLNCILLHPFPPISNYWWNFPEFFQNCSVELIWSKFLAALHTELFIPPPVFTNFHVEVTLLTLFWIHHGLYFYLQLCGTRPMGGAIGWTRPLTAQAEKFDCRMFRTCWLRCGLSRSSEGVTRSGLINIDWLPFPPPCEHFPF